MKRRNRWIVLGALTTAVGCTTSRPAGNVRVDPPELPPSYRQVSKSLARSVPAQEAAALPAIALAAATEPAPIPLPVTPNPEPVRLRPAYAKMETLPIDLPTVIRLVNENSPAIGFARARVQEAQARLDGAEVLWLPNLSAGVSYTRFDGEAQNSSGNMLNLSRGNLFASGGPALTLDIAEAVYRPLIERRVNAAERGNLQATSNNAELDAVSAYIDLVQVYALLEINTDTLSKAEAMLGAAKNAKQANLDRTAGDVQRAQTEVYSRKAERLELEGRIGSASARLGRLLLMPATVKLVPADAAITPITLIDSNKTLEELTSLAIAARPDLASYREAIAAADARVRLQRFGPLIPKVVANNQVGGFGGGLNGNLRDFNARNALNVQVYWELRNLGFGNKADADQRRAQVSQANYQLIEAQARALAEIVEMGQIAAARYDSLELAEKSVKEAGELYRISKEGTTNVVDAKNLFDALRPLQAIQALNQARQTYLNAVLEYNRAQFRLFTALGSPPRIALER